MFGRKKRRAETPLPPAEESQRHITSGNRTLRPMLAADVPRALEIIESHDEDDAEEAVVSFEGRGIEHFWVLEVSGRVVGVTGVRPNEAADAAGWLSWTYVHDDDCGDGHGRWMLETLLDEMKQRGVRILFISVSDYVDPEDGPVYAAAMHLYQALGFKVEVTNRDFYAPGENQFLLSKRLAAAADVIEKPSPSADTAATRAKRNGDLPGSTSEPIGYQLEQFEQTGRANPEPEDAGFQGVRAVIDEYPPLQLNKLDEIAETEGSFFIDWVERGKQCFTVDDVQKGLAAAKEQGARAVYITFPSNWPAVVAPLEESGFVLNGELHDYYRDGLGEKHFVYRF